MSKVYPALLKRLTLRLKKIREVWISNDFLKFLYQISIEFWIRNYQIKVSTIKFGKCFAEFMIPIALLMEFGSKEFVTIIEVIKRRYFGKANKLRYINTM